MIKIYLRSLPADIYAVSSPNDDHKGGVIVINDAMNTAGKARVLRKHVCYFRNGAHFAGGTLSAQRRQYVSDCL